jgi:hypothetical protein
MAIGSEREPGASLSRVRVRARLESPPVQNQFNVSISRQRDSPIERRGCVALEILSWETR